MSRAATAKRSGAARSPTAFAGAGWVITGGRTPVAASEGRGQ